MMHQIIQAIKDFDIPALKKLLDDDKTYMDVNKSMFLEKLEYQFSKAKQENCNFFEDHFFAICNGCNKGCEVITFITSHGHYLNLFFETKDQINVDDIYVCNNLENFTDLKKIGSLNFYLPEDDKLDFFPDKMYSQIKRECERLFAKIKSYCGEVALTEFLSNNRQIKSLEARLNPISVYDAMEYKYYSIAKGLVRNCTQILNIARHSDAAINGLIDYHLAVDERSQVEWVFQNLEFHCLGSILNVPKNFPVDTNFLFNIGDIALTIDLSGYEHVVDFYQKLDKTYFEIMMKYQPLAEHKLPDGERMQFSLQSYLRAHGKYLDLIGRPDMPDDDEIPF